MARVLFILVTTLLIQYALCRTTQNGPIVKISNGLVRGTLNSSVLNSTPFSSFRGIPFAQPPIGDLRFQPPVPASSWKGILNATKEPPACIQMDMFQQRIMGDEDCLYINVYTPVTNFKKSHPLKPVLFWIYGGGFNTGSSHSGVFGPDFLIDQDVVVVTFNYRLGVFGFLAANHPRALGNMGLKDQYAALRWVHDNIAAFGGDPKRVTIFGQSAGAASVGFHVLAKKAKGLFAGAIHMSGVPLCLWALVSPEQAYGDAKKLSILAGHIPKSPDDLVDFLSKAPASTLLLASEAASVVTPRLTFTPVVEDVSLDYNNTAYITDCPIAQYSTGNFNKVPMVMGYVHDETKTQIYGAIDVIANLLGLNKFLQPPNSLHAKIISTIIHPVDQAIRVVSKEVTKFVFGSPIDLAQKLITQHNDGNPVYYYRQSYMCPFPIHRYAYNFSFQGVGHTDDVQYVLYNSELPLPSDHRDPYIKYIKEMSAMFVNFAKYGNPTPANDSPIGITWAPTGPKGLQIDLNTKSKMGINLADITSLLYEKAYRAVLPLSSGCLKNVVQKITSL